jgi:transposase-like protein
MENKTAKRLSQKKWQEIKVLLEKPDKNISRIARKYKVDRATIYQYAWRREWIEKKKKRGFFYTFGEMFFGGEK